MRIFDWFKKRHDLKITIIEREQTNACRERLNLIKSHEKAMKKQAEDLRKEFDKELEKKIKLKQDEIDNLKKLLRHLQDSYENLHLLSSELSMEFRTAAILSGKSQNRFANIADRVLREADTIDKKIGKFISKEDV